MAGTVHLTIVGSNFGYSDPDAQVNCMLFVLECLTRVSIFISWVGSAEEVRKS